MPTLPRAVLVALMRWIALGLILLASVLFGAVEDEVRFAFFGGAMLLSVLTLILAKTRDLPPIRWSLAVALYPCWIALSLVPLPGPWLAHLSPSTAAIRQDLFPVGLTDCAGNLSSLTPQVWGQFTLDSVSTQQFLFQVCGAGFVFLASFVWWNESSNRQRDLMLWVLAVFAGAEAAYGLAQWFSSSPMVLWLEKSAYLDSATGTLINRNHFAVLLYLGLAAALTLLRRQAGAHATHGDREQASGITLAAIVALLLSGLLASKSRSGIVLGAALIVPEVPTVWRAASRTTRLVSCVLIAILAVPVFLVTAPLISERLVDVSTEWSVPQSRGAVIRASLPVIAQSPLFGTGAGTFPHVFTLFRRPEMQVRYQEAHNDYLQASIETGLPGLLLAVTPVGYLGLRLWRRRFDSALHAYRPLWTGLLAVAIHEFVDFPLRIPSLVMLVAFIAGAALRASIATERPTRRVATLISCGFGAVVICACFLHANAYLRESPSSLTWPLIPEVLYREAVAEGRLFANKKEPASLCRALDLSAQAQRIRPLSGPYAVRHAKLLLEGIRTGVFPDSERESRLEQIEKCASRARIADPWNTNLVRQPLVSIELQVGNVAAALADAEVISMYNDEVTPAVVDGLIASGVPAEIIASRMNSSGRAFERLLQNLMENGDRDLASTLVPIDAGPTEALCRAPNQIRLVFAEIHQRSAESLLRGCLANPTIAANPVFTEQVRSALAWDLVAWKQWAAAAAETAKVSAIATRTQLSIEIARGQKDWPAMRRAALRYRGLLQDPGEETEIYVSIQLGDALAHTGDFEGALRAWERALRLLPDGDDGVRRRILDLKNGKLPE